MLKSYFWKNLALQPATSFKKRLWYSYFPLNLNSWFSKKKNINMMCQNLISCVTRRDWTKKSLFLEITIFFWNTFFFCENDIAILICPFLPPSKLVQTTSLLFLNMFYHRVWAWCLSRINKKEHFFSEHLRTWGQWRTLVQLAYLC